LDPILPGMAGGLPQQHPDVAGHSRGERFGGRHTHADLQAIYQAKARLSEHGAGELDLSWILEQAGLSIRWRTRGRPLGNSAL
jgi:hypothetical protein